MEIKTITRERHGERGGGKLERNRRNCAKSEEKER